MAEQSTAHMPQRGDDVEAWLERNRDRYSPLGSIGSRLQRIAIQGVLDRYRECADYGLALSIEDDEAGDP